MMTEMLEKGARAAYSVLGFYGRYEDSEYGRYTSLEVARAVVEAMRELDDKAKEAFVKTFYGWNAKCEKKFVNAAWNDLIDAILKEESGSDSEVTDE